MLDIDKKKFMKLKWYGLATLCLSTIIVLVEYYVSREYWQHWIRISVLHITYQYASDPYFRAYIHDANLKNFWSRCWYSMTGYVYCYVILIIQWFFNLIYIIQLITGKDPSFTIKPENG